MSAALAAHARTSSVHFRTREKLVTDLLRLQKPDPVHRLHTVLANLDNRMADRTQGKVNAPTGWVLKTYTNLNDSLVKLPSQSRATEPEPKREPELSADDRRELAAQLGRILRQKYPRSGRLGAS